MDGKKKNYVRFDGAIGADNKNKNEKNAAKSEEKTAAKIRMFDEAMRTSCSP